MRFEIIDCGPGITEEEQPRLFAVFSQVDGSNTLHHGGTDPGLAISQQFCVKHGRTDGVGSQVEKDSTFWFQPLP
ncbi:hypothetical protein CMK14_14115 [Candidatus Poribacteria bacterium]|nr:hypothetical protein [Candidatus Poribacteria bacterium]